jgi:SagB-type dehydrogenase family enzyme
MEEFWKDLLLPAGDEGDVWELFHENSKMGRHDRSPSDEEILEHMKELHESLPLMGYPMVPLPKTLLPLEIALDQVIKSRTSAYDMKPHPLTVGQIATILHYSYGVTRDNRGTDLPRPYRVVPSAGALYPLEIFFHGVHMDALKDGLYHYNPSQHHLRLLKRGDSSSTICRAMVQPDLVAHASLIVFITALFERSSFKYGNRGYRFVMLEAGHVAQNINLVAIALGLNTLNIGGYFDREIDDFLGLDGITHSTIYMLAVGRSSKET